MYASKPEWTSKSGAIGPPRRAAWGPGRSPAYIQRTVVSFTNIVFPCSDRSPNSAVPRW